MCPTGAGGVKGVKGGGGVKGEGGVTGVHRVSSEVGAIGVGLGQSGKDAASVLGESGVKREETWKDVACEDSHMQNMKIC